MGAPYEHKTVKALRGTDSMVIAKWEKRGWELTDQSAGTLRTELAFRRPKPRVARQVVVFGALAVLCAGAITIGVLTESDDKGDQAGATSTPSSAAAGTATIDDFLAALKRGDLRSYAQEHSSDPIELDARVTGIGPETFKSGGFINLRAVVDGAPQGPLLKLIWGGFNDIPFPGNSSFGPGNDVRVRATIGQYFSDEEVWLSPDEGEAFIRAR